MVEDMEKITIKESGVPFPPSWIDRLIVWIDRLPAPSWSFYLLSILFLAFLGNAIFWVDGSMEVGSIDPVNTLFALFVMYWLAFYQHLTRVGSRALRTYRSLLDVEDVEFARIEYELSTLPRFQGWLTIPIGVGYAAFTILGGPSPYGDVVPRTAFPYVVDILVTGFLTATFIGFLIRSIRQLRMVVKLHARATNINLLKLEPVHAFSALTARTGMVMIILLIFGYFLDPSEFDTTLDVILYAVIALLAIAIFVLPIIGMRDRLDKEKQRVLDVTSDMLQVATDSLHNRVSEREYGELAGTESAINALIRERELFEKISTWPWDPRTIRGFASALLLPIFIWLVTRLLERFF